MSKNMSKIRITLIITELFQISLIGYLILFLAETVNRGFVTNYFNLNILLVFTGTIGILSTVLQNSKFNNNEKLVSISISDIILIVLFSLISGSIVFYKTRSIENISIIIAVITMVVTSLLSYFILTEKS